MAFPNFFGKQYESASNFLDDLEMAFLVSGRDEEEVKFRTFPLVLKDSAKHWFQNLEPGRKTNWETMKETFLSKYGGLDNPEHLWHRISSLHQATSRTYLTYESQFLRLWAEWEASLAEGERAPNFLKKEKFLAGLFPDLQEKVKGKFPETFEEALQIARVKDRKLEYQAHTSRVEHPQGPTMADERLPPAPTTTPEDPHLELLQRVTNQLDNLSINMVQGVRQQQPQPNNERMPNGPRRQPQRRDYFCYNCGEKGHGMYFFPHPRNFNAQAGRGRQQVTPPRARPPPQIQPQILQNPQMVAQPQVLQRSEAPQPVAEIPPLPNNNEERKQSPPGNLVQRESRDAKTRESKVRVVATGRDVVAHSRGDGGGLPTVKVGSKPGAMGDVASDSAAAPETAGGMIKLGTKGSDSGVEAATVGAGAGVVAARTRAMVVGVGAAAVAVSAETVTTNFMPPKQWPTTDQR
ncbi:hypothetical protein L7F22_002635 [Adiantum nelumboides]|nr:hypothetical protein [Adiantum nelumboides]